RRLSATVGEAWEHAGVTRKGVSRERPPAWRQPALALAGLGVYLLIANTRGSVRAAAEAHGRAVHGLERRLHLDVEHALNDWVAPQGILRHLCKDRAPA